MAYAMPSTQNCGSDMTKKNLLSVKNLRVTFDTYLGTVKAVRDCSFSVNPGETVAIVGESGCGKSVTALSLMRLLPKLSSRIEGEIWFEGENLLKKSSRQMSRIRGKEIGMIFQDPMTSLNPQMRIGKQIMEMILSHSSISREVAKQRVLEMLEWVGMADPEKRFELYPHQLSGGMRQRVMIAIALISNPKLVIADEPTTALDVTIQAQILELMKSIQKERQTSIILITHDLGIVAGMCDRVLVMYGGQIVEQGSVRDIYKNPTHPYTQGLLRSVPRLDMDKNKELIPILGTPPNLLNPPVGCPFTARCPQAMRICKEKAPTSTTLDEEHSVRCWLRSVP
jgi:oligopeptide transport system ATP-binding protein